MARHVPDSPRGAPTWRQPAHGLALVAPLLDAAAERIASHAGAGRLTLRLSPRPRFEARRYRTPGDETGTAVQLLFLRLLIRAAAVEPLGARLNALAGERLVVLHDHRIPGSSTNIDHIAVAPSGVFVIDAEQVSGHVSKRNIGRILRPDVRLYVGRHSCTALLSNSEKQAEVVRDALAPLGLTNLPVRPVLCFIGADWGLLPRPIKLGPVLVIPPTLLYRQLRKGAFVETATIQAAARQLANSLPAA